MTTTHFNYTTGTITTGGKNRYNYAGGGSVNPPTFEQKNGYFEIKCKVPRGKDMWSAFWMVSNEIFDQIENPCSTVPKTHWPPEIDIFEIEENGKLMLNNNNYRKFIPKIEDPCYSEVIRDGHEEYAIGYRYYDDYYTYAIDWNATRIKFYLNNELIYQSNTAIPYVDMYMMINTYVDGINNRAMCEPTNFPNYYSVDYVRVYEKYTLKRNNDNAYSLSKDNRISPFTKPISIAYSITPNPNNGLFTIGAKGLEDELCTIEITDIRGVLIESKQFIKSTKIDITKQGKGLYFTKLISPNKTVINKIIVK